MSDEIKKSAQDATEDSNKQQVEADTKVGSEVLNDVVTSSETTDPDEITNKDIDNLSAMDDPDVQASLKQLSLSENADKTTRIHTVDSVKNIVEAAIHAANKPISLDKIITLFPEDEVIEKNILRQAIEQLMQDYQSRGVELVEVSGGFRFQVAQTVAPWVSRLWEEKPQKYSRALLETLALVAYRQPITRGEIEEIRGVSVSSHIMRTLVEREWVRVIGHRDVPGKPAMYATTKQFLDYFGLKKLDELPTLAEIRDLDTINAELDFGDVKELNDPDNNENEEVNAEHSGALEPPESTTSENILADEHDLEEHGSGEDGSDEDSPEQHEADKRIDIDVELAALRETYKEIESIEKRESVDNTENQGTNVPAPENEQQNKS